MEANPAAIATILITPNIVLAYLGTGMQAFVLVILLMVMGAQLWADAWEN